MQSSSNSSPTRAKGAAYEQLAEQYLSRHGLTLVMRNFTCRAGELDLVMLDGAALIFIEVRYRERTGYGDPLETITSAKQRKLIRAAEYFLRRYPSFRDHACRFDAMGLSGPMNHVEIRWIKNAFSA